MTSEDLCALLPSSADISNRWPASRKPDVVSFMSPGGVVEAGCRAEFYLTTETGLNPKLTVQSMLLAPDRERSFTIREIFSKDGPDLEEIELGFEADEGVAMTFRPSERQLDLGAPAAYFLAWREGDLVMAFEVTGYEPLGGTSDEVVAELEQAVPFQRLQDLVSQSHEAHG